MKSVQERYTGLSSSDYRSAHIPFYTRLHFILITLLLSALLSFLLTGCQTEISNSDNALENPGSYRYSQTPLSIPYSGKQTGMIRASLYLPMVTENRTAPVVIFSPGFSASYSFYQAYFTHLASHGYAVLAMNTLGSAIAFDSQHDDKASQIIAALDYVIAPERSWSDQLDDTRIATAGHSMGAKLAFYAATLDARISVVLALDPVNAGGPPCFIAPDDCRRYPVAANPESGQLGKLAALQAASLILRSEPDKSTNPDPQFNAQWFFLGLDGQGEQAVPSPALYVDMGAVRHADYLTLLATDSNAPTHRLAKGFMLAWLQQEFEQQQFEQPPFERQDYEDYFSGATAQSNIDAGYFVSSQRR